MTNLDTVVQYPPVPSVLDAGALYFAISWADEVLARDYDVLTSCGWIQREAYARGEDSPAGFHRALSAHYCPSSRELARGDRQGVIAARACAHVAATFERGAPS